jgi:hypothetical protein
MKTAQKPTSGKRAWSVTTHCILPLVAFALGILVAASMLGNGVLMESHHVAPGTQSRLVAMMGQINDLE